jgi:hypothetical protein
VTPHGGMDSATSETLLKCVREVVGGKFKSNPTIHTVYCARAVEPLLGPRYIPDPVA